MIENIQNILNDVEDEKDKLLKENEEFLISNDYLNETNKRLKKSIDDVNNKYQTI